MGFIRFLIWTSMCIALGIFVASYEVDGRTPAQHLKQIWRGAPEEVKRLASPTPKESHSDEDRQAINRIVAKRK